uniref:Neuropeptide Y receptor type 6 n=1 Tax=Caligus clemensi TaxID=344056 RepID=C1C0Y3_CALCM|nr:Neuropeptide Y receptor type 6 [Caligus clemensi]
MARGKVPELKSIPKEHINDVYNYLMDMNTSDSGFDFRALKLRPVFSDRLYHLVLTIFFYAVLVIFGLFGNGTVFYVIWRKGSYKKYNILACVLNMTLAFLMQLVLVIPLTLFVIVVDNWVMGSALCHLLPMIQDVPGYSLMMTITILSYDRRRFLFDPRKGSVSVRWAIGLSWIVSFGLVLPYIGYIVFIDLSVLGPEFAGGQLCIISLPGKASTYIKTLFVFFYVIPMITSIYFLRRTSKIIRQRELEQTGYRNGGGSNQDYVEYNRYYAPRYWYNGQLSTSYPEEPNYSHQQPKPRRRHSSHSDALGLVDVQKEKRSQKFLYMIIITYFVCLFPVNVLK